MILEGFFFCLKKQQLFHSQTCMFASVLTADRPLVAQFAASNVEEFAEAAEIIFPYVDAVDLNCGCPQR